MIHRLNALLALALMGGSAVGWFGLPAEIPVHFDLAGQPDRWAETSPLSWFGPPLIGTALAAGMYALGRWLPLRPQWINLPGKDRYLALDPEERGPVHDAIRDILHWSTTFVLVLFALIQLQVWREAAGAGTPWLLASVLILSLTAGPVITVVGLVRVQRALDVAWRGHRARGGAPPPVAGG